MCYVSLRMRMQEPLCFKQGRLGQYGVLGGEDVLLLTCALLVVEGGVHRTGTHSVFATRTQRNVWCVPMTYSYGGKWDVFVFVC